MPVLSSLPCRFREGDLEVALDETESIYGKNIPPLQVKP
jgi:hypothetical protein